MTRGALNVQCKICPLAYFECRLDALCASGIGTFAQRRPERSGDRFSVTFLYQRDGSLFHFTPKIGSNMISGRAISRCFSRNQGLNSFALPLGCAGRILNRSALHFRTKNDSGQIFAIKPKMSLEPYACGSISCLIQSSKQSLCNREPSL